MVFSNIVVRQCEISHLLNLRVSSQVVQQISFRTEGLLAIRESANEVPSIEMNLFMHSQVATLSEYFLASGEGAPVRRLACMQE